MGPVPSHNVQAEPGNSRTKDVDYISVAEHRLISLIKKESILEDFHRLNNNKEETNKKKIENIERGTQTEEISILTTKNKHTRTENLLRKPDFWNEYCSNNRKQSNGTATAKSLLACDICGNKEKETYKFLDILSKELSSFYEGQTNHDCVLKLGDRKFPVHRSLLAARSPVFAAMFRYDTFECRNSEVDISDVDTTAFGEALYYMYAGKIRGLSPDTASSMYVVADKYSLVDLRDKCLDFLIHNLTVENICDAAILADNHNEEELQKAVIQFIAERLQELMNSENWRHFSTTHYLLANRLLSSALIACQTGKI